MVKMMKQGKMIKLMMMRSALGYPELGSALDYRAFVQYKCTGLHSKNHWWHCKYKEQHNIFVQLGHGKNNVNKSVSVHKWTSGHE